MLEFALIVPLYILLVGGIIDLGRGLERYFLLRRLAYEGGRLASNMEGLEYGRFDPNAPPQENTPTLSTHGALHGKIRSMVDFQGARVGSQVSIVTERPNDATNLVAVSLSTGLEPILLRIFPALTISARVEAPYLFVESE